MLNRRSRLGLVAMSFTLLVAAGVAVAKNQHHNNGHNLLGAELNQDGKHEVNKIANNSVTAEVRSKKVVSMTAGSLPMRKVKSNKRMAELSFGGVKVAANADFQLAQVEVYYGYCFDAGLDEYCYWYPAADVIVTDTWIEYLPL